VLDFVDPSAFDGLDAGLDYAGKVIRMNDIDQGPVLQLLVCFAEILQGLAVEKLDVAPCARRRHQPGNVIDDLPPRQFARSQAFLCALAILNVNVCSVPPDDLA